MRSGHTRPPREPGTSGGGLRIIEDSALEALCQARHKASNAGNLASWQPCHALLRCAKTWPSRTSKSPGRTCHVCSSRSLLSEFLREPDENSFGTPDVAEPIRVFVLDYFADELRAAFYETGERIVNVFDGKHDA